MISIDGCATERGGERKLSEPLFVVMLYTSMSDTGLHVYYRYLITNEGFSPEVNNGRLRRGADTADSKILNFYNNDNKKMIYIFLIYIINVYIYTVSSVSKGVKRQCRMYVQPAGQTVSNLFGICGLNLSTDGRQMTNRGPLGGLVWSERELP